jgi:hypothetical protein
MIKTQVPSLSLKQLCEQTLVKKLNFMTVDV